MKLVVVSAEDVVTVVDPVEDLVVVRERTRRRNGEPLITIVQLLYYKGVYLWSIRIYGQSLEGSGSAGREHETFAIIQLLEYRWTCCPIVSPMSCNLSASVSAGRMKLGLS